MMIPVVSVDYLHRLTNLSSIENPILMHNELGGYYSSNIGVHELSTLPGVVMVEVAKRVTEALEVVHSYCVAAAVVAVFREMGLEFLPCVYALMTVEMAGWDAMDSAPL